MNCEQVKQELLEQFGGHTYSDEVANHLSTCVECKDFANELAELGSAVATDEDFFPTPEETEAMVAVVESRIDALEDTKITPVRSAWHAYIPAVAALLVVVGFSVIAYWLNVFHTGTTAEVTPAKDTLLVSTNQSSNDLELTSGEVDYILNDFAVDRNETASEYLLDDLSQDELEYLQSNLKAGDIL